MIDLAVIPVAGAGTRLLPSTKSQPKEMLPVGRKPVVQYVVEELAASGVQRMLFVTGPGKHSIENHFDLNQELINFLRETGKEELLAELAFERAKLEFCYTRQRRQLGLGHAVLTARPFVGQQSFVVALGDSILGIHAQSTIDVLRGMTIAMWRLDVQLDRHLDSSRKIHQFDVLPYDGPYQFSHRDTDQTQPLIRCNFVSTSKAMFTVRTTSSLRS